MRWLELLRQLWQSQRGTLLLLAGLLALNVLAFGVLEKLVAPRLAEEESRFLQRQAEVRQLLHNQGGVARTPEQQYVLASQDLSRFRQTLPDYQEFTGLIEDLLVHANRARLNIDQISYAADDLPGAQLMKFSLTFDVAGEYAQLKKFIHALEQSQRLMVIRQISLRSADGDDVSLRLNLETFFLPGGRQS